MYCTPRLARPRAFAGFPSSPLSSFMAEFLSPNACNGDADPTCCSPAEMQRETARLPLDIHEKDNSFVITASVPGFRKEDVAVEFHEGVLTITATRDEKSETSGDAEGVKWHRRERRNTNLSRSLRLPETVNGEGIGATLADGVLTVTVPQLPSKGKQSIPVN